MRVERNKSLPRLTEGVGQCHFHRDIWQGVRLTREVRMSSGHLLKSRMYFTIPPRLLNVD